MTLYTKSEAPEGHSYHHMCCPHDCPDTCSILVTRNDKTGKVVRVQGDPTHPITKGYLCNKVNHYVELVYNDNRVLYPHKRVGPKGPNAKFERIGWDEALDTITDNMKEVISEYGSEAVQPYSYSGHSACGLLGYGSTFLEQNECCQIGAIDLHLRSDVGRYLYLRHCNGPSIHEACSEAEVIILWGTNLVSTGVHAIPFIQKARKRGVKLIVIDPRVTRTTMMADWHIQRVPAPTVH